MTKPLRFLVLLALPLAIVATASDSRANGFYDGKMVRFVVGFAAGGGFDTYTRAVARHIGKHIPGNPSTLVENKPGAGSLIAANYVFNKAKPDGLTIGNFMGPLILQHVLGNEGALFDGRKFGWVGVPVSDHGVCAIMKSSGVSNLKEWFASKRPIKIGATGPGSTTADIPKLIKAAIGLPIKVIEGYGGTAKVRLAAEAGEIDGGCWAWQSIKVTWRKGLESGNVVVPFQATLKPHQDLMNVDKAIDYAKTEEARELLEILGLVYGDAVRPFAVPPGTPKKRLMILQKAFMDTMKDPELLAESKKAQLEINPIDGSTAAKAFAKIYQLGPGKVAKLKKILVP
jgi:tripartite-type tricarboxylate transporter receptor subunit TctC